MSRTFLDRLLGSGFRNRFFMWGLEGSYQRQKQWKTKETAIACSPPKPALETVIMVLGQRMHEIFCN